VRAFKYQEAAMKFLLAILLVAALATPALAQTYGAPREPDNNNRQGTVPVVPAPMQALGNVIRNPEAPPPRPPANPTGEPPLPSTIPQGALANPDSR
jgi:hypothetical protein